MQELEQDQLKRAFSRGVLTVTGARLWNALHSETWRHREAAVSAFLEYAGQDPLVSVDLISAYEVVGRSSEAIRCYH